MSKLKLNAISKISLTDGVEQDLGLLKFDLTQFNIPESFVFLAKDMVAKVEKSKNQLGELIETGTLTLTFKLYDRAMVEMAIMHNLNEFGSPITLVIENQTEVPNLKKYDDDELIPISLEYLTVTPKKVQKKAYSNNGMVDVWQYASLKISATNYKIG